MPNPPIQAPRQRTIPQQSSQNRQTKQPVAPLADPAPHLHRAQIAPDTLPDTLEAADVAYLQRAIGNRAVARLVAPQRRRLPESSLDRIDGAIQAAADVPVGAEGGPIHDALATRIRNPKGNGQVVPQMMRERVEETTGRDLSSVKVHNNKDAHEMNKQLGARAFTQKNNIFLGENESPHDVQLMAHELTHTIQQTGNNNQLQRKTKNIRLDKRLKRTYGAKRVNSLLDGVKDAVDSYNAIPLEDTDYVHQLKLLNLVTHRAKNARAIINHEMFKANTWRSLGGPFRHAYYMLQRNLIFLAGDSQNVGIVEEERQAVKRQIAYAQGPNSELLNPSPTDKQSRKKQGKKSKKQEETPKAEPKYWFGFDGVPQERWEGRGIKRDIIQTFTVPMAATRLPIYDPRGEGNYRGPQAGDEIGATGRVVFVTIRDSQGLKDLEVGETVPMYEFVYKLNSCLIPKTYWERMWGPDSYPKNPNIDAKNQRRWFEKQWSDSPSTRPSDAEHDAFMRNQPEYWEEQEQMSPLERKGWDVKPSHLKSKVIPKELESEQGSSLTSGENDLNSTSLDIPKELEAEGGFSLTGEENDLDPARLDVPKELESEQGFTLL